VGTLHGSLGCDSPPKSVSKGARFLSFSSSRLRGVLGGISSIPLVSTSVGGIKLGYGLLIRCSYCPQSLVSGLWSDSGYQDLDLEELTRGCCSSRGTQATPVSSVLLTGLNSATPVGFLLR
jgi:hypothetical protein